MEQALQERLDRIGQRMDTFEEKPGRMDELATKASVDELPVKSRRSCAARALVRCMTCR